jgi:hypothetical protein
LIKNASWTKGSLGQLFEKFDTDKSGRISSSEFKRAFEGLGLSASQYDVEQLVRRIDKGESWRVWHFAIAHRITRIVSLVSIIAIISIISIIPIISIINHQSSIINHINHIHTMY